MYRTLGTRGRSFGVPSGPYAAKDRTVLFHRLEPASKQRLLDAVNGTRALAPILRSAKARPSFFAPGLVSFAVTLFVLVRYGWPAGEKLPFALAYAAIFVALAAMIRRRGRSLTHGGSVLSPGTYLFPLDVIDALPDGTLRLRSLGGLQEAAVGQANGSPALVLTFKDGAARTFPVGSERQAEAAYDALEAAQEKLEHLTYGSDMADAVNLDPFFEVRVDDTWASVEAAAGAAKQGGGAGAAAAVYGAAVLAGLVAFGSRNLLATWARAARAARLHDELSALEAKLAKQEAERAEDAERQKADEGRARERAVWEKSGGAGLEAYRARAPSSEMVAIVTDLTAATTGLAPGLDVVFTAKKAPCVTEGGCAPVDPSRLVPLERRFSSAFQQVLSETVPRAALPVRLTTSDAKGALQDEGGAKAVGALTIDVTITPSGASPQAIAMVFDVKLAVQGHGPKTFRLTMPPPVARITHVRDRSVFELPGATEDEVFVYARGLDRLYDEVYGLFFTGAPRVPVTDSAAVDVQKTFGAP